ncbi:MAG: hypothetical protein COA66_12435 [Arcobacter sp.]|nr:MAG: hypothetical protein COA66_12435 [Arcobacter sp.]
MKTVVLIIDSLIGAGAETTNIRLAEAFLKNSFNVYLITIKDIIEVTVDDQIKLFTLSYEKNTRLFNDMHFSKLLDKKLEAIKNKENTIDLILGSLGLSHKLMNRINNKYNFYYVLHGTTCHAKLSSKKGISKFLKKQELRNLYKNKHIICVSNGVKKDIESLSIIFKSIKTIYNPFNFEHIIKKSQQKLNLTLPKNYIVHVGRFAKVKRHDILLKAFSLIKDPYLKLVLVGEGKERKNIEKLINHFSIASRVILLGFQDNPYPIIKEAKALVLSSQNEGFGNVLIESLILNTRVVSTDAPVGPREILEDILPQSLAPVNDPEKLASSIQEVIDTPLRLKENCLKQYNTDTVIKEYIKLLY